MNDNYLWDKTGEDAEIERLEQVLQVFRHQENSAPILPPQIVLPVRKPVFTLPKLAFASLAGVAVAFFVIGFWFVSSNRQTALNSAQIELPPVLNNEETLVGEIVKKPQIIIEREKPQVITETKFKRIAMKQPTIEKIDFRVKAKPEKISFIGKTSKKPRQVKLTEEEKFAYDQLMLALSITSSKLKMVREKVDGVGLPDVVANEKNETK